MNARSSDTIKETKEKREYGNLVILRDSWQVGGQQKQ